MFALLSQKNGFVFVNQMLNLKALNQYSVAHKIRFRLFTDFKTKLQKTQIQRESFWRVSKFASFSQKIGFVFVNQIRHFKALNQYSVAHKIQFRLLIDLKINLQETQIQGESSSGSFKGCLIFLEKWFCIYLESLVFSCRVPKFISTEESIYAFGRIENKFTGNSNIKKFFLVSFKVSLTFPEKWFCVR